MTALLLTLHLWQAPVAAPYQANLHLLPTTSPAWLAAESGSGSSTEVATPATEWGVTLAHRAIETVAGALGFGLGEGALGVVFYGLIAAARADGGGGAGDALLDVVAVAIAVVDLIAFPMLFVGGAWLGAYALGLDQNLNIGRGMLGAYLGTIVGLTVLGLAVIIDVIAFSSSSSQQSTALLDTAYASIGFVPVLGSLGAAIGLHWDGAPSVVQSAISAPVMSPPPPEGAMPPIAQPPPVMQPPPVSAPPLPPSARIPVFTVHFG